MHNGMEMNKRQSVRLCQPGSLFLGGMIILSHIFYTPLSFAQKQELCSEPLRPSCVDIEETYVDHMPALRCEQQIEAYEKQAQDYIACQQAAARHLEQEMKDTRALFERKRQEATKRP